VFVGDFEDAVHDVLRMLRVEAAARYGPPPYALLVTAVAGFDDLRVSQVRGFGKGQEIVCVVAVRALPRVAILVAALEGDVVESSLVRLVCPDAGRDQSDADFPDRGVLRFSGFFFVRALE